MSKSDSHFLKFDNEVHISSDLTPVIKFMQAIEEEIETMTSMPDKFESVQGYYLDLLNYIKYLGDKLKKNSIEDTFEPEKDLTKINGSLDYEQPVRAQFIIIFAYLETLFCLIVAYQDEISKKSKLINQTNDRTRIKKLINRYCLNADNEWVKDNKKRANNISANDIRDLRNSLTHFFSLSKSLGVTSSYLEEQSRRLEEKANNSFSILSPKDLREMVRGAGKIMILEWNNDCRNSLENGDNKFNQKISCVKSIVQRHGAMIVKNEDINL